MSKGEGVRLSHQLCSRGCSRKNRCSRRISRCSRRVDRSEINSSSNKPRERVAVGSEEVVQVEVSKRDQRSKAARF